MMNVAANRGHPSGSAPGIDRPSQFADQLGEPIHNENADEIGDKVNEIVQLEHGKMVALSGPNVKAGKCSCSAVRANQPHFPAFSK